jgi:hypothetical protein
VNREEQRRVRELRDELARVKKAVTKASGFEHSYDYVFRFVGDFAYWVNVRLASGGTTLTATLFVKCARLDPLFWDIADMPENRRQPRSFHVRAAFAAPFLVLPTTLSVQVTTGLEPACTAILGQAEQVIQQRSATLVTVEDFRDVVRDDPRQRLNLLLCEIWLGHHDTARALASAALGQHDTGGFSFERGSIYAYAQAFLDKQHAEGQA